jgi:hypothetical protein
MVGVARYHEDFLFFFLALVLGGLVIHSSQAGRQAGRQASRQADRRRPFLLGFGLLFLVLVFLSTVNFLIELESRQASGLGLGQGQSWNWNGMEMEFIRYPWYLPYCSQA